MTKLSVLQQYLVFDFFKPEILSFFFVNWWTLNLQKIYQIKSVTKQSSKFTLRKLRGCPFFACAWVRDILVTNWKRQRYMNCRCAFFTEMILDYQLISIDSETELSSELHKTLLMKMVSHLISFLILIICSRKIYLFTSKNSWSRTLD